MPPEQNDAAEAEPTNALSDEQTMEKFQGGSTQDGVPVERAEPAGEKPSKGGATKAKGAESEADEDESDAESKRHKSAQERINKAVGRQRAAERKAESLEQQLAALETHARTSAQSQNTQSQVKPKSDPNAPQPTDYEYGELDASYIRDLARHEARQEFQAAQSKTKQEQDNASQTKAQQAFQQKLDGFLTKGLDIADDFDEVVRDEDFRVSVHLAELAMESEHGPEVLYSAASDPKEAKRISAMSPARQAAWFGQKEAELSSGSSDAGEHENGEGADSSQTSASPKTTQAPPPPKGKTRGNGSAQQVSSATTDFSQFERLAMKKQE